MHRQNALRWSGVDDLHALQNSLLTDCSRNKIKQGLDTTFSNPCFFRLIGEFLFFNVVNEGFHAFRYPFVLMVYQLLPYINVDIGYIQIAKFS